jgi:DNA-binding transcriptional ArsR family regulator
MSKPKDFCIHGMFSPCIQCKDDELLELHQQIKNANHNNAKFCSEIQKLREENARLKSLANEGWARVEILRRLADHEENCAQLSDEERECDCGLSKMYDREKGSDLLAELEKLRSTQIITLTPPFKVEAFEQFDTLTTEVIIQFHGGECLWKRLMAFSKSGIRVVGATTDGQFYFFDGITRIIILPESLLDGRSGEWR